LYVKYFFQLLNGLKSDDYVPGSINCGLDTIATQQDFVDLNFYFSAANEVNRPRDLKTRREDSVFTILK
jgi:hypothetical protein